MKIKLQISIYWCELIGVTGGEFYLVILKSTFVRVCVFVCVCVCFFFFLVYVSCWDFFKYNHLTCSLIWNKV